ELPDYHSTFELRERRHQTLFTDQLALHILELPKFKKGIDELATPLDRWLYFLRNGEYLDAETVPVTLDVPELRWALGDLFMISRIDPERDLYEARLRERRDKASFEETVQRAAEQRAQQIVQQAAETAAAKGREQGHTEGRAEALRTVIPTLQKSLGQDVLPREELQMLSCDELETIWTRLQNDLLDNHD
ncbi:MAG: hypothetical protein B7Z73_13370, partial [Planctomycetia bacterium 21-64-5]